MMHLKYASVLVASLGLLGCTAAQRAAIDPEPAPAVTTVPAPVDNRVPGEHYLYYASVPEDQSMCGSLIGKGEMPCRLVLNICATGDTTVFIPHFWKCSAVTPTLAEACAEQPEYAEFYACWRLGQ